MIKSDIPFKPEQIDILNSQDKNLIVSASAGSGKTTVMISKIADLIISKKVSVNSILVLTYTDNAANEMKQKLLGELKKHVNEYEFLEDEIENIDQADISTIHSFCQKLIRKNFYAFSNLSPNFSILSNEKKAVFKVISINNVLEKYKQEKQEDYLNLIKIYDQNRSDNKIIDLVFAIDNFLDSYLEKENYRQKTAFYLYDNPNETYKILNKKLCDKIGSMKEKFVSYHNKSEQLGLHVCSLISADVINALQQFKHENDFLHNIELLSGMDKLARRRPESANPEFLEEIIEARNVFVEFKKNVLKKNYSQDLAQSFENNANILKQLLYLQKSYEEEYSHIKHQNNVLDFSDLERYAIKLTNQEAIQKLLKEKYSYIFIDEFQDANEVQEKLISNIARANNRFMVGDVKQSIYGFRRSNPQIFLDLEKKYQAEENSESKTLNLNFRSDSNILEFVNSVFSTIMTLETAQIDYKNKSMFQPNKFLPKTEFPRVCLNIALQEKETTKNLTSKVFSIIDESNQEDEEATSAEREAFLVAKDILKLKGHYLFDGNAKREVNYSDMSILVKKRGKYFDKFCSCLTNYGVPIYANSAKSIFEMPDILKLLSLLKITQNFYDDYSLSSTMLSFVGNFTYQELADIKLEYQHEKYFYNCVINYSNKQNNELSKKIQSFSNLIKTFSLNCKIKGAYLSLQDLLSKTEFKTKTYALDNGLSRVQTIEKFVDVFKNPDFNFNIQAFLAFCESENKEIKTPNYTMGEVDCVNITTIHSSKGLEFPIVFVVQTGADFTKTPDKAEIKIHEKFGIGLKFYDTEENKKQTSFVYEAIDQTIDDEEFAEVERLLYVGLTRAKEYLYVYGTTKSLNFAHFEKQHEIMFCKSYLDLIMNSIDNNDLKKIITNKHETITKPKYCFAVNIFDDKNKTKEEEREVIVFSKGDKKTKDMLKESLTYTYPNKDIYKVALKNSVSSLLQADEYASQNYSPNKLLITEHLSKENDASNLGTLYHKILQRANFENYNLESLGKIKQELETEDEQAKNIKLENVIATIEIVNKLSDGQLLQKEKKFIMQVPYSSVSNNNLNDEVLVQGIIDVFSLGKKNVLIDYKLTSIGVDEKICEKYKKQIYLYKMALKLGFNIENIDCYIIDINGKKEIKLNI